MYFLQFIRCFSSLVITTPQINYIFLYCYVLGLFNLLLDEFRCTLIALKFENIFIFEKSVLYILEQCLVFLADFHLLSFT